MNSCKKSRDGVLLRVRFVLISVMLMGGQWSYAKESVGAVPEGTVVVKQAVLQELIDTLCAQEADHRMAQDNPEKQTNDDFTYACTNRWQVKLQIK